MSADDDKRTVIGLLEREWHSLDVWLRSLDDRQLDRPMFGEAPGWRVRDMVTHMAWWQELAGRVAEKIANEGGAPDDRGSRPFLGIEPTGKQVTINTIDIWRVEGDKLAEHWDVIDIAGLQKQLHGG